MAHQKTEYVVRGFFAQHELIPHGDVIGTQATHRKHTKRKIIVLVKPLLTKVTVCDIPDLIFFWVSPYGPIWVELCTVFFFCVFPFLIVIRRPNAAVKKVFLLK